MASPSGPSGDPGLPAYSDTIDGAIKAALEAYEGLAEQPRFFQRLNNGELTDVEVQNWLQKLGLPAFSHPDETREERSERLKIHYNDIATHIEQRQSRNRANCGTHNHQDELAPPDYFKIPHLKLSCVCGCEPDKRAYHVSCLQPGGGGLTMYVSRSSLNIFLLAVVADQVVGISALWACSLLVTSLGPCTLISNLSVGAVLMFS